MEPSIKQQPVFELPTYQKPVKRNPLAWWFLLALFALMILGQLVQSLMPDTTQSAHKRQLEVLKSSLKKAPPGLEARKAFWDTPEGKSLGVKLDQAIRALAPFTKKDSEAALIWLAMRYEAGQSVTQEELANLAQPKTDSGLAALDIYSKPRMTLEEAAKKIDQIDDAGVVVRAAKLHAAEKAGKTKLRAVMQNKPDIHKEKLILWGVIGSGIFLIGALLLFAFLAMRASGRLKEKGHPLSGLSLLQADASALRVGLFFVLIFCAQALLVGALKGQLPEWLLTFVLGILMLLASVAVLNAPLGGQMISLRRLMGPRKESGKWVLWGIGAELASIPIYIVALLIAAALMKVLPEPSHPVTEQLLFSPSTSTMFSLFFLASVVAPITEELVFRGILLPAITRVTGKLSWGIFGSAFLFAALHPQGPALWPALMAIGAVNAYLTGLTGSLIPAISLHAAHNTATLGLALLLTR